MKPPGEPLDIEWETEQIDAEILSVMVLPL
jgi:hypothetical protein